MKAHLVPPSDFKDADNGLEREGDGQLSIRAEALKLTRFFFLNFWFHPLSAGDVTPWVTLFAILHPRIHSLNRKFT